jgi:hypothetical protein
MFDTVSGRVRCRECIEGVVCSRNNVSQVVVSDIAAKTDGSCGERATSW